MGRRNPDGRENEKLSYSFQVRIEEPQQETDEICAFSDFTEEISSHAILATFLNTKFTVKYFPAPYSQRKCQLRGKKKSHPKLLVVRKCKSDRDDSYHVHEAH